MKQVTITFTNGAGLVKAEIGSYKQLREKYAPGTILYQKDISPLTTPELKIKTVVIQPSKVDFWECSEPTKAYKGKLTYQKLCILVEHTDFSKLDVSKCYGSLNLYPVYWNDIKQCFEACKYQDIPKGSFYIFVGWFGMNGKKPDIKAQEVKIKRYHTQEYAEPSFIGGWWVNG